MSTPSIYGRFPPIGGVATYATFSAFPASAPDGTLALARDTDFLYAYNAMSASWVLIAGAGAILSMGVFDSGTPSANGAHIDLDKLVMQSASASNPGLMNIGSQTIAGVKTFNNNISAANLSGTNTGDVTLGTANGLSLVGQALSLALSGTSTTGALSSTDWNTFNNKQSTLTLGNLTDAGTDGITVTGGTGAVVGTGTSLSQHVADTTHNGYLSSTDWNTFNGKQASGNYITALTGDVTATGPGSVAATLATVNSNVGSFGSSTSIPSITVNAKGLITAASGNVVIAPAGTLTGTTLASNVVTSSLTSLGTQASALNMGSHQINAVTDPSSAQDAATKNYVDTVASGLQPIQAVYAATIGSNISGTYLNGASGVGATFTTTSTSTFTLDGTTPPLTSRVLFKDQTSGFQNGVYNLTTQATGIVGAIFTRALDYNTASDMNAGNLIPVVNGTVNSQTSWLQTATITTVGTDSLVFVEWTANPANYLLKANNLSDVASKSTSFNNISPMTTGGDVIYGGASGAGTRLANGSSGQVLTSNGGTSAPSWNTPSSGTSTLSAYVREEQTSGTNGGTFSAGAWHTRTLTTSTDPSSIIVSLTSNQFTLAPGTYIIDARAPAFGVDRHQTRLANQTDSTIEVYGSSQDAGQANNVGNDSIVKNVLVVTGGNKAYTIDHQCQSSQSSIGFGVAAGFGNNEVYTQITVTKIA